MVNGNFGDVDHSHYKRGIKAIEHRWENCIEFEGDYVEDEGYFCLNF